MTTPHTRATDPLQYDEQNVDWAKEGGDLKAPTRANFWYYLEPYSENWKGKSVLDVGSGTSWLLNLALKKGAARVLGIEPSKKNQALSQTLFPEIKVFDGGFEDFQSLKKFDVILAIMSLSHIADLEKFFAKAQKLLNPQGQILAIVNDFEYFRMPRFNYQIEIQEIDPDEYVVSIIRPTGTIADVVRSVKKFQTAAKKNHLKLIEDQPLPPAPILLEKEPRYSTFKDQAICRLLRFENYN